MLLYVSETVVAARNYYAGEFQQHRSQREKDFAFLDGGVKVAKRLRNAIQKKCNSNTNRLGSDQYNLLDL